MLADDFDQAYRCFLSNFYDASVCLARRALERALLGKGVKSRRLGDMIEDSVNQGIVPPEVKTLCEDIKAYGNKGAHPKSNDVPVSQGEAEYALLFTDVMVAWLYGNIRPANSNISLS